MTDASPPDRLMLRIERTFHAPARAVFDAWTSTEVLRRWWPAGPDWDTPVVEVDVRVGGKLRLVMPAQTAKSSEGAANTLRSRRPSAWSSPGPEMGRKRRRASNSWRSNSRRSRTEPRPSCSPTAG
jgi:hypothetical protein